MVLFRPRHHTSRLGRKQALNDCRYVAKEQNDAERPSVEWCRCEQMRGYNPSVAIWASARSRQGDRGSRSAALISATRAAGRSPSAASARPR